MKYTITCEITTQDGEVYCDSDCQFYLRLHSRPNDACTLDGCDGLRYDESSYRTEKCLNITEEREYPLMSTTVLQAIRAKMGPFTRALFNAHIVANKDIKPEKYTEQYVNDPILGEVWFSSTDSYRCEYDGADLLYREYNDNHNMLYELDSDDRQKWAKYENGNETYYKNSSGYERWHTYDADGRILTHGSNRAYKE